MTKFNKFYKEFLKLFKKIYFTPKTIKKPNSVLTTNDIDLKVLKGAVKKDVS